LSYYYYFFHSFKLASSVRRTVFINHTDPAARDHNGFNPGSYYVGVYGWCTPDDYVVNWETDGPCSYAAQSLFNVTVELVYCKFFSLINTAVLLILFRFC
jgi:hypothetical protein